MTDPSLIWALALLALGGERILTASFSHTIWIAAKEPPSQVLAPEVRLRQPGPEAEVPGGNHALPLPMRSPGQVAASPSSVLCPARRGSSAHS